MTRKIAYCAAAAFAAAAWLQPAAHAAEPELQTRIFDVRLLVLPLPWQMGPVFSLGERLPQGEQAFPEAMFDPAEEAPVMTEDQLLDAVGRNDPDAGWDASPAFLRLLHGRLLARNTAQAMERLASFLRELETGAPRRVTITVLAFGGAPEALEAGLLAPDAGKALAERVRKSAAWWEEVSATGSCGQRFYVAKGTQFLYISEYDVEVASEAKIHDPLMSVGETGVVVDAMPQMSPSGSGHVVTIRVSCAYQLGPEAWEVVSTPGGKMTLPKLAKVSVHSSTSIPLSSWLLLGSNSGGGAEGDAQAGIRFLIRVSSPAPAPKK